ncbi:hypothetical protein [Paenibacillus pasadenensis]|uniref:AbiTii domain-containing protein n=1 Tax=Paenibacillus pasadenensis TaxID=217090 RepID=UPI000C79AB2E|nr:hypothetical protein [Paenibacillus pasadenensis]
MARSQLLKDIASGKGSLESILLRLKVILSDLNNNEIIRWIEGELAGYKDEDVIPNYRVFMGQPIGTYIQNLKLKMTNAPVPLLAVLSQENIDKISEITFREGIASVQNILDGEERNSMSKILPASFCHGISIPELQIFSMNIVVPATKLEGIIANVKSKLLSVVLELEKQFVNLDDLDIREQMEEDPSKRASVSFTIENIVFDHSIAIGDRNKIESSSIGHSQMEGS